MKTSSRARLDQVPGKGVGRGQHVPVEVHGHLRLAGGARGRREHGHVVGSRIDGGERAVLGRAPGGQVIWPGAAIMQSGQRRRASGQVLGEAVVAQGQAWLGQADDGGDFPGPQQGHRGDRHPSGLDHREPGHGEPGCVRAAEQDPVARAQAEILGQHLSQLVGAADRLAVGPGSGGPGSGGPGSGGPGSGGPGSGSPGSGSRVQAGTAGARPGGGGVEEFRGAVESLGIAEFRQVEAEFRPLVRRGEAVAAEGVEVC